MIKGFGTDIVEICRIERLIEKYSTHFLEKVFTPSEITYCGKMANPAIHFAGRWAAKEAFYKALPVSCQKHSYWKSIEIVKAEAGKPQIQICTNVLRNSLEKEGITLYHLSISHERSYCIASVILEDVAFKK